MLLGHSQEGLPIEFDEASAEMIYKDTKVSFYKIKEAVDSGLDNYQITENLHYSKTEGFTNFGCLTLSNVETQKIIKTVWKLLKTYKTIGN